MRSVLSIALALAAGLCACDRDAPPAAPSAPVSVLEPEPAPDSTVRARADEFTATAEADVECVSGGSPEVVVPMGKSPPETEAEAKPNAHLRLRVVLPKDALPPNLTAWVDGRIVKSFVERDRVTLSAPPGRHDVAVYVPGCVTWQSTYEADVGSTRDLGEAQLVAARVLEGRVVDVDGRAVAKAIVFPSVGEIRVPLTITGEDGAFRFDGLPLGEATLRVEADGYAKVLVVERFGPDTPPVSVRLARGGLVRGALPSGVSCPTGVWILVVDPARPDDTVWWTSCGDDGKGAFEIRIAPGKWRIVADVGGSTYAADVDVKDGAITEVELKLATESAENKGTARRRRR